MYATISDLIKDIFNINIPLPIQTFGFFMALAFVFAAIILQKELKRKENEGRLYPITKKILKGKAFKQYEYIYAAIIGFIIGFKLFDIILNYNEFANNPQNFLISANGNFLGGIITMVIALLYTYRQDKKQRLSKPILEEKLIHPYELIGNFVMLAAIFGLIGAKLFNSLENIDDLIADPIGSLFGFSGLTFYGGLITASIAIIFYAKKNNISLTELVDAAAPALMLAYAIGRIGCQLSGDGDWGIVNTAPKPHIISFLPDWMWGFRFPHNVINEGIPIEGCVGKHCYILAQPVFPTSFYETTICIILFFVLWLLRKKLKIAGMLFSVYLILNGIERFFIEKIRVNFKYNLFGYGITQAEIISFCLIIVGIIAIFLLLKRNKIIKQNI
jgi:prolipoprotein diacylglyceryl transferase